MGSVEIEERDKKEEKVLLVLFEEETLISTVNGLPQSLKRQLRKKPYKFGYK